MGGMITVNSEAATQDELIHSFVELYDSQAVDGVLSFATFQSSEFIAFWPHASITELDEEHVFHCIFWGTRLADVYGKDLTGTRHSKSEFGDAFEALAETHIRALEQRRPVYLSGTLHWKDKDYQKWHRISVPLLKNNVLHVLAIISFEDD